MLNQVRPINKSLCLQMLCEENFVKLHRLDPSIDGSSTTSSHIHTQILESGPYTRLVLIRQHQSTDSLSHTQFKCRVYLDTKAVEVLSIDGVDVPPHQNTQGPRDVSNEKWSLNYLLAKWLNFQLLALNASPQQRHPISV